MKNILKHHGIMPLILTLLACVSLLISCSNDAEKQEQPQTNQPTMQTKAEVGKPAPDFTLTDLDGKEWHLNDLKGKVVFLNFWATWCQPCVEEMPAMETLNKRLAIAPFKMITILSNDRPEFAQKMVQRVGATFPVLIDPNSIVGDQYGLTGVPETFIIDADGIVREKFIGPRPWDSQGALDMLGQYLPGKQP